MGYILDSIRARLDAIERPNENNPANAPKQTGMALIAPIPRAEYHKVLFWYPGQVNLAGWSKIVERAPTRGKGR